MPCEDERKEIESLKNVMLLIGRLKGDNEKILDRIFDTKKRTEASKKKAYQELFRKNLKKIYDHLRTIQVSVIKHDIELDKFGDLRKERTFRSIKYDPEEIRVDKCDPDLHPQRQRKLQTSPGPAEHRRDRGQRHLQPSL